MKHLNIKITLLAASLLLAIGQSKANESELQLANSPVSIFSNSLKTADFKSDDKFASELTDSPFLLVKRCFLDGDDEKSNHGQKGKHFKKVKNGEKDNHGENGNHDEKGTICKTTGQCVASQRDCPRRGKSPHDLDHDGI